jgi:hypothetical protein
MIYAENVFGDESILMMVRVIVVCVIGCVVVG